MVNASATPGRDAERELVLSYAPVAARAGLAALLALDDRLGGIVATTTEPVIGQMRLTWWFEALERLDTAPPPAEPLLQALAAAVLPAGVRGAELAGMIDGWEPLLTEPAPDSAACARERGGRLFAAAARVLGEADARIEPLGAAWASVQQGAAMEHLFARPWPRALRPLGALALLAASDLAGGRPGSPGRVTRLFWHRLTGR